VAVIRIMPNGLTASMPREGPLEDPVKRGIIGGWSKQTTQRMRRWFYGVDGAALDGFGLALSLTVRILPPTPGDWRDTREAFFDRMRRDGLIRGQWLTEWQRRCVPHMHGALYLPKGGLEVRQGVLDHWLAVASRWGAEAQGQTVKRIDGLPGWFRYQAKHSARGVRHYQRANRPEAWQGSTGRMWGVLGEWPSRASVLEVDNETFWRLRRRMRSWLIADARKAGNVQRAVWLRGLLRDPDRARSYCRGIGEFCPEAVATMLLMDAAEVVDDG
jgi:hypothetical protein